MAEPVLKDLKFLLVEMETFMEHMLHAVCGHVGIVPYAAYVGVRADCDDRDTSAIMDTPLIWLRILGPEGPTDKPSLRAAMFNAPHMIAATRNDSGYVLCLNVAANPVNSGPSLITKERHVEFALGLIFAHCFGLLSLKDARGRAQDGIGDGYDFEWLDALLQQDGRDAT